jgi:hypothetical protein
MNNRYTRNRYRLSVAFLLLTLIAGLETCRLRTDLLTVL